MSVIKPPNGSEIKNALDPYIFGVGAVAYTWCRLIETMGLLFIHITKIEGPVATAIWYSLDSDRSQLKMLQAAIQKSDPKRWMPHFPKAQNDFLWLVEKVMNLSDSRNNAVHAPAVLLISEEGVSVQADPLSEHQRAKKLKDARLEDEFRYCTERAELLENFAHSAMAASLFGDKFAWPNKPSLPNRPQKKDPTK